MVLTTFNNVVSNVLTKSLTGGGYHTMHHENAPLLILVVLVLYVILLMLGQWIWNNVLIIYFPDVPQLESIWHLLGLAVLAKIVFC